MTVLYYPPCPHPHLPLYPNSLTVVVHSVVLPSSMWLSVCVYARYSAIPWFNLCSLVVSSNYEVYYFVRYFKCFIFVAICNTVNACCYCAMLCLCIEVLFPFSIRTWNVWNFFFCLWQMCFEIHANLFKIYSKVSFEISKKKNNWFSLVFVFCMFFMKCSLYFRDPQPTVLYSVGGFQPRALIPLGYSWTFHGVMYTNVLVEYTHDFVGKGVDFTWSASQ